MARQIAPRQSKVYLQPILLDFVQQASPGLALLHASKGLPLKSFPSLPQLYFGMNPYAMPELITTPNGWNIDSSASRKRRFCPYVSRKVLFQITVAYLRDEFETYGGVDGDIASHAESNKGRKYEYPVIG